MSTCFEQELELTSSSDCSKAPPLYRVILINDDSTPMDFVVIVLEKVFFISRANAIPLMLKVHHEGRATCGIYTKDIAETKVNQVKGMAQANNYILQCVMEMHE